jgi:hypothetical protein
MVRGGVRWGLSLVDEVGVPETGEGGVRNPVSNLLRTMMRGLRYREVEHAAGDAANAKARSHDVELVALHGLWGRILEVVMRLVVHVPVVARVHSVVVTAPS